MTKPTAKNSLPQPQVARAVLMAGALLMIGLAQSAKADYIYTYTGNPVSYVVPQGYPATSISGSLELASPLPPNSEVVLTTPNTYPASPLTAFNFTDGVLTLNASNSGLGGTFVSTDSSGVITTWCISIYGLGTNISTSWIVASEGPLCGSTPNQDYSHNGVGNGQAGNYSEPGIWTESGTPEPTTTGLTALGGAILLLARRRHQHNRRATRSDRSEPS